MGWGLLDKSILLVTEDDKVGMLNKVLSQWPDLYRKTAIWPTRGSSSLPAAEALSGLEQTFGEKMKIVLHRDSDFMLDSEKELISKPYKEKSMAIWFTPGSDMEALWVDEKVIACQLNVSEDEARDVIDTACAKRAEVDGQTRFNKKRNAVYENLRSHFRDGSISFAGHDEAHGALAAQGLEFTHVGKELLKTIRGVADEKGLKGGHGLGKVIPEGIEMASDLKTILQEL